MSAELDLYLLKFHQKLYSDVVSHVKLVTGSGTVSLMANIFIAARTPKTAFLAFDRYLPHYCSTQILPLALKISWEPTRLSQS